MAVTQEQIDNVQAAIDNLLTSGEQVMKSGGISSASVRFASLDSLIKYRDKLQKLYDKQTGTSLPVITMGIIDRDR